MVCQPSGVVEDVSVIVHLEYMEIISGCYGDILMNYEDERNLCMKMVRTKSGRKIKVVCTRRKIN